MNSTLKKKILSAHAHSDCYNSRPLYDALDMNFLSIEPDTWFFPKVMKSNTLNPQPFKIDNGKLIQIQGMSVDKYFQMLKDGCECEALADSECIVAHDENQIKYEGSLNNLYLKPIEKIVDKNSNNKVYDFSDQAIILLVDIKVYFSGIIKLLNEYFAKYKKILCHKNNITGETSEGAVKIVLSGLNGDDISQKDLDYLLNIPERFVYVDGRIETPLYGQLEHPEVFPLVSDSWKKCYESTYAEVIQKLHKQNRMVRFWGTADTVDIWKKLKAAGVDLISTDKLQEVYDLFE